MSGLAYESAVDRIAGCPGPGLRLPAAVWMQMRRCVLPAVLLVVLMLTMSASAQADTWSAQSSDVTSGLNGVGCSSGSDCAAVGDSGTILTSTDGGNTWTSQNSNVSNTLYGVACPSSSDCVAVGDSGTILISTDGGNTWTAQDSNVSNTLGSPARLGVTHW
jgi:photosystem II stability/assembly factor-like uncharacterized protein